MPGAGLEVPIWILGSSLFGAQVAAAMGLPFAFASHFAPDALLSAIDVYRSRFRPSASLSQPHLMIGVNFFAADTEKEARKLFTSLQIQFTNLFRGCPGKLQPPNGSMEGYWSPSERAGVGHALQYAIVGSADTAAEEMQKLLDKTGADEVMFTAQIFDHEARLKSFQIAANIASNLIS